MKYKVSNVCQLLDKSVIHTTQTINGVTFTNNGDGSITANGATTAYYAVLVLKEKFNGIAGHIYFTSIGILPGGSTPNVNLYVESKIFTTNSGWIWHSGAIYTWKDVDEYMTISVLAKPNITYENSKVTPQLFDLTEMYGAGNEPTTVAQFRADFPDEYYEYSPECWKRIRELRYVQETRNLIDKNTVKVIDGYVWSGATIINPSVTDKTLAVPCKPNTTYTVSKGLAVVPRPIDRLAIAETSNEIDKVGVYSSYSNIVTDGEPPNSQSLTITTTSTAKSLVITIGNFVYYTSAGTSFERVLANVQLEEGSTATSYQPYGYLGMRQGKYVADKRPAQLISKNALPSTKTVKGVTFTNNGDGSVTASGVVTTEGTVTSVATSDINIIIGHKYCVLGCPEGGGVTTYQLLGGIYTKTGTWVVNTMDRGSGAFFTPTKEGHITFYLQFWASESNVVYKPQLFDLTEIYGAGNEPTTVEKFRQDFPDDYYEYNPYNYKSFN